MTSNVGAVETTSSCVFWLTGKSGYQEFISEKPSADPVYAYMKVKTEDIGYGEIYKTDKSTGTHLKGAVYGIYSDSNCKTLVEKMTTDKNGYAKSGALTPGTYYVQEITAPEGYVRSDKIHTLTIKAGQTKGIDLTDVEQVDLLWTNWEKPQEKVQKPFKDIYGFPDYQNRCLIWWMQGK